MCTRQSPGHTSPPPPLLICGSRRPRGYSLSPREWKAWHAPDLERAARQRSECRNCWMLMWRRSWDRHNSQPEQTDSGDDRSSTARGCQTSLIVRPEADMPLSGWRIGPAHDREWVVRRTAALRLFRRRSPACKSDLYLSRLFPLGWDYSVLSDSGAHSGGSE